MCLRILDICLFRRKRPERTNKKMNNEQLCSYLKENCLGKEQAISGREFARLCAVSENELRRRVNRLRREGEPIASNHTGYFYARTAGDVYATIRALRKMTDGLEAAIRGLERAFDRFGGGEP